MYKASRNRETKYRWPEVEILKKILDSHKSLSDLIFPSTIWLARGFISHSWEWVGLSKLICRVLFIFKLLNLWSAYGFLKSRWKTKSVRLLSNVRDWPKRNLGLWERNHRLELGVKNLWKIHRLAYGFCFCVTYTSVLGLLLQTSFSTFICKFRRAVCSRIPVPAGPLWE